ncbi:GntR family transcriptional regulator [Heyndrickxia sporothermodurans]|uniref:FadR/GntR family transcriptional regulator n=3 Tax=Heyndrickxia sporothermodurans TaxID=46224 RepID=UPI002DC04543|nr:GntR family transcriptional regulator [Heyndrickxia sporothermodurans]MEB6547863.1 GntR family transcriptional regulator [Heyndrickxia sporothermodurans]
MNKNISKTKVYLEIVDQIRQMIYEDGLVSGDKLPSERELSERLKVGRSSVREGLRALELLGLIETRRGEGTYLRDFTDHHLVELLSMFILQDDKVKNDVKITKELVEKDAIRLVINNLDRPSIELIKYKLEQGDLTLEDDFFLEIVQLSNIHLLFKIWLLLKEYASQLNGSREIKDIKPYLQLLHTIVEENLPLSLQFYDDLKNMSK